MNQNGITVGNEVWENMGKPKKIDIYYDSKNKVIKLELDVSKGAWRLFPYANGVSFRCVARLSRVMPKGKYIMTMKKGIFKFEK